MSRRTDKDLARNKAQMDSGLICLLNECYNNFFKRKQNILFLLKEYMFTFAYKCILLFWASFFLKFLWRQYKQKTCQLHSLQLTAHCILYIFVVTLRKYQQKRQIWWVIGIFIKKTIWNVCIYACTFILLNNSKRK